MPVIIKEIHVRTVVERRIVTETEVPEEIMRKIEKRILDRLSANKDGLPAERRGWKRER